MSARPAAHTPLATRTLDHCLACGGGTLAPLAMAYEFRGRFPLVRCATCGIRFLGVQPAAEALAELYSAGYFEADYRCGRSETAYADESAFRAENEGLLQAFEALVPERQGPRRLLEVGCAGGWLLKHARERGWEVRGAELSADAVTRARSLGLEIAQGDLESARYPDASFDLVYMGDVLEHVPDCQAALRQVARVLVPGGIFFLRGPITTNSLARELALTLYGTLGRTIVLKEPPYHLWEFTPATLRALLERAGLRVEMLRQSKIAPGRAHGRKSALQRAAMYALDTVNRPLTAWFNARGDRVTLAARRPA
ncbi:MAG: class I SAM-dependent methyltransferase [Candidatus Eisenbacteria bacterium]